jgi:hypothetical protein
MPVPEDLPDCPTEAAAALTQHLAGCPVHLCEYRAAAAWVQGPAHCCRAVLLRAMLLLVPGTQRRQGAAVAAGPEVRAASFAGQADDAAAGRAATAAATDPGQPLHSGPGTCT